MNIPVFPETKVALKGKKALVVGIANEHSIAWGCARAFRALGAELAVTYLDERAKPYVEPLAKELQAPIFMPLNVDLEGQTEKVFERIEKEWGKLDILLHSIAFSPKEALHGRVIDVGRDGFLKTMDVSCWSFIRMAHLAEPLMKNGGTMFTMTYYGSQSVIEHYNVMGLAKAALEAAVRYIAAEVGPGSRDLAGTARDPGSVRHSGIRRIAREGAAEGSGASSGLDRRCRRSHRISGARRRQTHHGRCDVYRRRLSHHRLRPPVPPLSKCVESRFIP
jgi:enoyl-[acyl-carrier protein] reductase I